MWSVLRKPAFYWSAIANVVLLLAAFYISDTYLRASPMFFDTDSATWQYERMAFAVAFAFVGQLMLLKLRILPKN